MFRKNFTGFVYEPFDLLDPPQKFSTFEKKHRLKGWLLPSASVKLRVTHRLPTGENWTYSKEIFQHIKEVERNQPGHRIRPEQVCWKTELLEAPRQETETDPHKKFEPSIRLTNLVYNHLDMPDEIEARVFNIIRKFYGKPATDLSDIDEFKTIISREIEGFLANLARRSEEVDTQIYLSKKGRITSDICIELIDRLQLDAFNTFPVFERLFVELFQFASQIPRERSWGQITVEGSELVLKIGEGALAFPDFGDLDEEGWIEL